MSGTPLFCEERAPCQGQSTLSWQVGNLLSTAHKDSIPSSICAAENNYLTCPQAAVVQQRSTPGGNRKLYHFRLLETG